MANGRVAHGSGSQATRNLSVSLNDTL